MVIFRALAKKLRFLLEYFSTGLSKLRFTGLGEHFKNKNFPEKISSFQSISIIEGSIFGYLSKTSQKGFQNCFLHVYRNFSRRRCSYEPFRHFRSLIEIFTLLTKRFRQVWQNWFLSVARKKSRQKYFLKKAFIILFWTLIELISAFCRKIFNEVVKAAFYVSIATFWKKNAWSFQMLGRKPSAFCDKLIDRVVKTAFQVYMGISWAEKLSDENLTFSCSDIERKVFTFVRKFFNWVVKSAFFVSRSVLCVEHLWQESCRVLIITFGLSDKKYLLSGRKITPCFSKVLKSAFWLSIGTIRGKVSFGSLIC